MHILVNILRILNKSGSFTLQVRTRSKASSHSPHELKANAEVVAEVEVVQHVDDVVAALHVLGPEGIQDLHLHQGLVMETLLVANDLNGHRGIGLVVQGL